MAFLAFLSMLILIVFLLIGLPVVLATSAGDVQPPVAGGWMPIPVDDEHVKAMAHRALWKLNSYYDHQRYHLGLVKIHSGIYTSGVACELLSGNELHPQNFTATIYNTNAPESEWEVFITGLDGTPTWMRSYLKQWTFFKSTFGKHYSPKEDKKRLALYLETSVAIDEHNKAYERGEFTYSQGINKLADWTKEERERLYGFRLPHNIEELRAKHTKVVEWDRDEPIPESIDWREQGYVAEVKNQGGCGVCWAFSSTGHLEGRLKQHTGELISLSEQNLMDCTGIGCAAGSSEYAFEYVVKNGIQSEKDYPYEEADKPCRYNSSKGLLKDVQSWHLGNVSDEEHLKILVAKYGPISVGFAMANVPFHQQGVYYNPNCTTSMNHMVTAVGYGHDEKSGLDYWLLKNSWGPDFGESGYFRAARNKGNMCYVATHSAFVLFKGEEES